MHVPLPDASTAWQLWYRDTFDRDSAPSLQASGEDILRGLYELWRFTLTEGILENGSASFSHFYLTWGNTFAERLEAGVQPFDNTSLLKLRQWAQQAESRILHRLAERHYELLGSSDRWSLASIDPGAEARELLRGVEAMTDPAQL